MGPSSGKFNGVEDDDSAGASTEGVENSTGECCGFLDVLVTTDANTSNCGAETEIVDGVKANASKDELAVIHASNEIEGNFIFQQEGK